MAFLAGSERIKNYPWMMGFEAAIYDDMLEHRGATLTNLGLFVCGEEYESPELPPYCNTSVGAASLKFGDDLGDTGRLIDFVDGYKVSRDILEQEEVGASNV